MHSDKFDAPFTCRITNTYDTKYRLTDRHVEIALWSEPVYEVTYGEYDGSNEQIERYTKRQFAQLLADALKKGNDSVL